MFSVDADRRAPEAVAEVLERVLACRRSGRPGRPRRARRRRGSPRRSSTGANCCCSRSISSTSATNFSKHVTRPPSSQPADCQHTFAPGEERGAERVEGLVARLEVDGLAGRQRPAARSPRQPEAAAPSGPTRTGRTPTRGRRTTGAPDLHVGGREERAHDAGRARAHQLHQRQPGQHLGRLLDERRGHGDRRHRPHQQERRHDHRPGRPPRTRSGPRACATS